MFNTFALYNTDHGTHRLFGRYLSAIDLPGNVDFTHVPVATPLACLLVLLLGRTELTSTPLQDARLL